MPHSTNGRHLEGALIGYGFIGAGGHTPAYLQRTDVKIVAVVDTCPARLARAREILPGARFFKSVEDLFSSGAPLDFVDIATPPCEHFAIAHHALERGLHVLCEKPLTTDAGDAKALMDRAVQSERVIFPCHNYKFAPVIQSISSVIASGRIGRVGSVTLETLRPTHAKGVPEWNPDWRRHRRWSGGGIAMDHGSHTFYLAFDWLNAWPTDVTAKMMNREPDRWDTEDDFSATLTFPGGRMAHAHMTWTAGNRAVIYTIHGDRGAIVARDDELEVVTPVSRGDGGAIAWHTDRQVISSDWMDASHARWFNAMFDRFVTAIEDHDYAGADVRDAYRCVAVIGEAYASSAASCLERHLATQADSWKRDPRPERRIGPRARTASAPLAM